MNDSGVARLPTRCVSEDQCRVWGSRDATQVRAPAKSSSGSPPRPIFSDTVAGRTRSGEGVCHRSRAVGRTDSGALDLPGSGRSLRASVAPKSVGTRGSAEPRPHQPVPATSCSLENISRVKERAARRQLRPINCGDAVKSRRGASDLCTTYREGYPQQPPPGDAEPGGPGAEKPDREAGLFSDATAEHARGAPRLRRHEVSRSYDTPRFPSKSFRMPITAYVGFSGGIAGQEAFLGVPITDPRQRQPCPPRYVAYTATALPL